MHVLNYRFVFIAKWHVTVPAYCHCIINYYLCKKKLFSLYTV